MKPGHDGQITWLRDGHLEYSIEAEKDNWPRYATVSPVTTLQAFARTTQFPDVVALSGWTKDYSGQGEPIGGGYNGHSEDVISTRKENWFGRTIDYFTSSHERSHVMCSYGLSPYAQGEPCYVLVWESEFGSFYHVDENVQIRKLGQVLQGPGVRYSALYALADPSYRGRFRLEDAGKLMALAGFGQSGPTTAAEAETIRMLMAGSANVSTFSKEDFKASPYYDIGLDDPGFRDLARKFSDAIFDMFLDYARNLKLDAALPLLISGGCGLNCDWNSAWKDSGLFRDVFVPPCTNDTGAAIGTAIDAQFHFTKNAKVSWSAYSGEEFVEDDADLSAFEVGKVTSTEVAGLLFEGNILGWVQGRYEIGPRALGNRSILAAPFSPDTCTALNRIKEREGFRPIAPVCLEEDFSLHFAGTSPSPHMLYFHRVLDGRLGAVTHVDGSARAQTVSAQQNSALHGLLREFKSRSGVGVLCNTSLNFKGAGFINKLSDLVRYSTSVGLDGFVVGETLYRLRK